MMSGSRKSSQGGILRLALVLFAFSALVAVLLGLTDRLTAERIRESREAKTKAAMSQVLAAERYDLISYPDDSGLVQAIYRAEEAGYVVMVTPSGFGGSIEMAVGIDPSGAVTGISIIRMSETSGLGANAKRQSFREQFTGTQGSLALRKQGGEIDGLTGATVTSTAVVKGVNAALSAVRTLG